MPFLKNDFFLHVIKCNLMKLSSKSGTDWQYSYLLRAVVVSGAWLWHMLMWFFSHIAALVGDLAGFLVPPSPPPPIFPLVVSVMGAWMPGVGAHVWVVWIASRGSATRSRDWLAGFPWTSQAPNLHFMM